MIQRKNSNSIRVLVIPDRFRDGSGAIVAQVLVKLLKDLDYQVGVYCSDIEINSFEKGVELYNSIAFKGMANLYSQKHLELFGNVLNDFNPTHLFFIGSITNKPLCYLEEGLRRKLQIEVFIFMQDFFCYKLYANDLHGPCKKCLEKDFFQVYKENCKQKRPLDYLKQMIGIRNRIRLQKLLKNVDWLMTSSDEQVSSYVDYGILPEKIMKISLFFDSCKLEKEESSMGNYFIGIAQNRVEKGFHLMQEILRFVNSDVNVLLAFNDRVGAQSAIEKYKLQEYIDKGVLEVNDNLSWNNGLGSAIAKSKGVIIPSIWPSTTEYGLLEALGLKKPVFVFDVGIHKEIIQNGVNGYCIPLGHYKEFAETLNNFDKHAYDIVSPNAYQLFLNLTNKDLWKLQLKKVIEGKDENE